MDHLLSKERSMSPQRKLPSLKTVYLPLLEVDKTPPLIPEGFYWLDFPERELL